EGGDAALVAQLGQRVDLVLELAELAAPEELAQGGHDRPAVDELLGRGGVGVAEQHALAHAARHAPEADADLVGDELAYGADAAVAEVVDVVDLVALFAGLQAHEVLEGRHESVVDEATVLEPEERVGRVVELELLVHLE